MIFLEEKRSKEGLEGSRVKKARVVRSTSSIRQRTVYYRFYLVKPNFNTDLQELSMQIMSFKEVAEVYLTEGDSGILVKTKFFNDSKPQAIEGFLKKTIPYKYGILVSPIQYEKYLKNGKPYISKLKHRIAYQNKVKLKSEEQYR
ncbi:hypothetical protein Mia14_0772 [Candidatus Mancarchaeum acidiphilum]|uniref:Uncharacterized protein n=1 Tax=Candidatus Mancarchaeum acidiphilum TaxID=1920749 RepID=A0A218NNN8_9ARCH|nr:hypothetical protein Mia14_0772 [Candidatus Mancarchaeum acidiphilum]